MKFITNQKKLLSHYKKDIISLFIFTISFIFIYLILTKNKYLFASTIDFKYQHYLIPEYFRTLFYSTYDLFPDFALNLGSGQNIYYLSYYGLFNPFILLSYLFPNIKMINYMIITNCLIVLISTYLFYFYLRKNKYNEKTSFITSFLFLTSGPLIFHSKRHIMFINYFPFLILGLYGIDNYLKTKNITLLTISISLIILTSYYFSIPALIVLFLYSVYKYIKITNNITIKSLIIHYLNIAIPFILGIMITSILTIPTLYTLLNGRTANNATTTLKELLTPNITKNFFYNPYSLGLTLISLISLLNFIFKGKKETKYLSTTCLLISILPIFNYILNGTLYINPKSLIPFIILILLLVAKFLSSYLKERINLKQILLLSYLIITSFSICLYINSKDKLMNKKEINNPIYNTTNQLIQEITKKDNTFYRINTNILKETNINKVTNINEYKTTIYSSTSNQYYTTSYNKILKNPIPNRNKFMISPSNNLISNTLLNEKYIITKDNLSPNLKLIKEQNNIKLYKNTNVLPLGYATNKIISKNQYQTIPYPINITILLNNIIIDNNKIKNKKITNLTKNNLDYKIIKYTNLDLYNGNNNTIIKANKNASMTIKLNKNNKNKLIFIRFNHEYIPNKDLAITINNTKNKLTNKTWKYYNDNTTFNYILYNTNNLDIFFKEGTYQLNNFESYTIDYNILKNLKNNIDEFNINKAETKGDTIKGNINVRKNNSYFTLSIPYDKGFKIKIDNKITNYQKSGTNFIAFPISKGKHNITITYKAPYKKISLIISILGIILTIILSIKKHINNRCI